MSRAARSTLFALTLALGLALASPAGAQPAAAPADSPMGLLQSKEQALRKLLEEPASPARTQKVKTLADSLIDYQELALQSLGDALWAQRSEAERKEFTGLLQSLIEKSYVEQTEKDPKFQVRWQEQEMGRAGDRARIVTLASARGAEVELEYRLQKGPKGWIVYNLLVDGVSMSRNYRKTFKRIIKKEGWPKLVERMRKKLAGEADAEIDATASEGRGRKAAADGDAD